VKNRIPAIDTVMGFTGGGRGGATNSARMFISLKAALAGRRNISAIADHRALAAPVGPDSRGFAFPESIAGSPCGEAGRATPNINSLCAGNNVPGPDHFTAPA